MDNKMRDVVAGTCVASMLQLPLPVAVHWWGKSACQYVDDNV